MRHIYSFFMYLLTPFLLLRLWWKGRKLPGYRARIAERFCLDALPEARYDIWVHAVSLGEVIAATPLINQLLAKDYTILVTTMTPTGAERVKNQYGGRVSHRYVPYDLPVVLTRFFKANQIRVGVIVETELWPNLIDKASKASIPLLLVNARLSERSCKGYEKIRWLIKPVLNQFQGILAQAADDAERFRHLGAESARVTVLGNVKFDLETRNIDKPFFEQIKQAWGDERMAVIAASTHDNEEQQILTGFRQLRAEVPDAVLLIAPRHPERFQLVYQLACQMGFNTALRSQAETISTASEVIVLDCLGEMLGFYHVSNYAFVGGSFVSVGGHNVLEPIAMNTPVFSGPNIHNFKTICQDLQQAQAIEMVANAEDLMQRIIKLRNDKEAREKLVANASQVLDSNKGAVARYIARIESVIM
ncbi:lipid IV(A) 3-deoxy-D-manno-octulosonic acid transferase [Legionella dresdenensis]|uniref:3-deoxy-D-manno-octulosonic acid transferase n=1 Tax=Legionella dresdenensis TaxID=450200 RepID=A0ABV8CFW0_9GAMM